MSSRPASRPAARSFVVPLAPALLPFDRPTLEITSIVAVALLAGAVLWLFVALGRLRARARELERQLEVSSEALATLDERLAQASRTDFLTSLPNRRRFVERAESERLTLKRTGRGFALIRADLDRLKLINDRWGNECGDQVLAAVASTLRDSVRERDVVARWGGVEFVLLLPETVLEGARVLAEKIRARVEALRVLCGEQEIPVTITLGVTEADLSDSLDSVLSRADAALTAAKVSGRNRVETWAGEKPAES